MSDEDTARPGETPAARAARRARRIGGRSRPETPGAAAPAETTATDDRDATDATGVTADTDEAGPAGEAREHDEATDSAGQAPAAPTAVPAAAPGWRRWAPALVLAAACVGLLVYGLIASRGVWWDKGSSSVAGDRGAVLSAAKGCMATMNTYDYRKLDQAEAAGIACTTGTFTGQYKAAFDKLIKPNAATEKFTQTAQINNAGIERVSPDGKQWVVLVFGQLSTTNSQTGTSTPTLTPFSARVTLQKSGGKWLVANYQYAPSS